MEKNINNRILVAVVAVAILVLGVGVVAGLVYERAARNRAAEINKTQGSGADTTNRGLSESDTTSQLTEEDIEIDNLLRELDPSINQIDPSADFSSFSETDAGVN